MNTTPLLFRILRHVALSGVIAMGAIGQAFAAAIIIDNFSGTLVGTRGVTLSQGGGAGTPPTFTESGGGGAIRLTPQNSIVSAILTYTPGATIDLTGGGTNDQFLIEYISVIADNGLPLQGLANLSITVNTTSGAKTKSGLGITNGQENMAFPFSTFSGGGNFAQVTSIVLSFFSQTNLSAGRGTITLDRIWASPLAGAVPTPPGAGFTAITATPTASTTINHTLTFSNNQGAAPVTGLTNSDISLSGTAGATTVVVTGSGSSYNVAISGMTTDGTVIATLGANTLTDLWLQSNPSGATSPTINYVRPPVFTNGPPPNSGTVGTSYPFTYTTTGLGPITYSIASGALPAGVSMSSGGVISGTPTSSGSFNGTTRATNVGSTDQAFTINVVCPALTMTPTSLPNGAITVAYSQSLGVTGVTGSFNYVVTAGTLPAGLTLSSAGALSGTPTGSGISNFTVTATGPGAGNCTASRAYSLNIIGTFTVTPSAGIGGSISPNMGVVVNAGGTTQFTITTQAGYVGSVGGTCGGSLNMINVYTTNAINSNCTVIASFVLLPVMTGVDSRKTHGVQVHNLPITTGIPVTGNVTVEPRMIKSGHVIVFKFSQVLTAEGTVAAFDSVGAPIGTASVVRSGSNALVTLTGIPDNKRVRVALTGVASANGSVNAEVALAFLVGDMNDSRAANAADISGVKSRNGILVDGNNFRFDVNVDGVIDSADTSAVKARSGLRVP